MSDPVRLFAVWFMGLIKGAILSGLLLLPFFGPWAMAGGTLAFSLVCLGLALKRVDCASATCGVGTSAGKTNSQITQADTCHPKLRR